MWKTHTLWWGWKLFTAFISSLSPSKGLYIILCPRRVRTNIPTPLQFFYVPCYPNTILAYNYINCTFSLFYNHLNDTDFLFDHKPFPQRVILSENSSLFWLCFEKWWKSSFNSHDKDTMSGTEDDIWLNFW